VWHVLRKAIKPLVSKKRLTRRSTTKSNIWYDFIIKKWIGKYKKRFFKLYVHVCFTFQNVWCLMDRWLSDTHSVMGEIFSYMSTKDIQVWRCASGQRDTSDAYVAPEAWQDFVMRTEKVCRCHSCHGVRSVSSVWLCGSCHRPSCAKDMYACPECDANVCRVCSKNNGCLICL